MSKTPETEDKRQHPINIDEGVREWMRSIGYIHESEIEHATLTTPRSRARWTQPRGIMFGNERWYPISGIKRDLDAKAETSADDEPGLL